MLNLSSSESDPERTSRDPFADREVMEYRGVSGSLRLDADGLNHLAPLLGVFRHELAEVGRRTRKDRAAQVRQPRLHLGIGEAGIDLPVELINDVSGGVLGRADARPGGCLEARQELSHGWHVRQCLHARRRGYCERAQSASADILNRRNTGAKEDLHLPTEQIGERWPG